MGLVGIEFRTNNDVDQTRMVVREISEDVLGNGLAKGNTTKLVTIKDAIRGVRIAGAFLRHGHASSLYLRASRANSARSCCSVIRF